MKKKKLFIILFYPNEYTDEKDFDWVWGNSKSQVYEDYTKEMKDNYDANIKIKDIYEITEAIHKDDI